MESTLFTTLTATEEANLSGGWDKKKKKSDKPSTPAKPVFGPINVNTQIITVVNTGDATKGGTITQVVEAVNGNA